MKYLKNNKYTILTIVLLSCLMFYFIGQKQGFHEDEIFSYGSSNYKYDNVYRSFGDMEARNDILYNKVLTGNIKNRIANAVKYLKDPDSFPKDNQLSLEMPIFKTKDKALEYVSIQKYDIFNYFSVYYNQALDVHPPLFYFLVHFISTFFYNSFSKYIIFTLNLIFFIGTLILINKIMNSLNHKELSIPTMIIYGASMGCISTVMFQRMYMMLTFFSILHLYNTLKFIKNDFNISNKKLWTLNIILGFLTQYYFCIYIVLVFILVSIYLFINKKYKEWFNYFKIHLIGALIGIVFYPFSIEDIFFSYRGIGSSEAHTLTFIQSFKYYICQILKLFSLNNIITYLFIIFIVYLIYKIISKQIPKVNKNNVLIFLLLFIPTIFFILVISKIAPFLGENYTSRYIMLLFPIIAITMFYLLTFITDKHLFIITLIISILLSTNGLINTTPTYLYKDYAKAINLANNYSDDYFVYVYDNYFTHLNSIQEFMIYKEHIILNHNIHDFKLLDNEKLNDSNEFILCIKSWLNQEEILEKVLEGSGYNKYEKLLELNSDVESVYYKITKGN